MKKGWKLAAGAAVVAGAGFYGGSLAAFRSFFLRNTPKVQKKANETYYAYLSQGELADRYPTFREGIKWLRMTAHEDWYMNSFDGLRLHARFYDNPAGGDRVALLCHGYHSSAEHDFGVIAQFYYEQGFHLLVIDERSHEGSEGRYICFGVKERYDVVAWCKWLVLYRSPNVKIYLHGVSMGCTTAVLAAALPDMPENLMGVVADCGFTNAYDEFAYIAKRDFSLPAFPFLNIIDCICKHRAGFSFTKVSTVNEMSRISVPILFVHGEKDVFVPPEHTHKNYAAFTGKKDRLLVPDAGHALCFLVAPGEYRQKLLSFFETCEK